MGPSTGRMYYNLIVLKDLRNKTENTNPASVLDGNIDQFIEEGLRTINEKIFLIIY